MVETDSTGVPDFVERFGLWSEAQRSAAVGIGQSAEKNLDTIRLSFADQQMIALVCPDKHF